jgi:hypothetical protein
MRKHQHPAKDQPDTKPTHDEVAKKAYAISQQEGHPPWQAEQDWSEAEAQLQHAGSEDTNAPDEHGGHDDGKSDEHGAHDKDRHDHHDHHAHMAADFRKRFWISLTLTLPILALSPMLQTLVGLREAIHFPGDIYVLFGFSSAVFWYGGWPFLKGLVEELRSRRPGMMTLISVAITRCGKPFHIRCFQSDGQRQDFVDARKFQQRVVTRHRPGHGQHHFLQLLDALGQFPDQPRFLAADEAVGWMRERLRACLMVICLAALWLKRLH